MSKEFVEIAAAATLCIYAMLFIRLVSSAPEQRALLRRSSKPLITVFAGISLCVLVFGPARFQVGALAIAVLLALYGAFLQHKTMASLGASPAFLRKLAQISSLAFLAIILFGWASILESAPAAVSNRSLEQTAPSPRAAPTVPWPGCPTRTSTDCRGATAQFNS
jgi:hypothetical protein